MTYSKEKDDKLNKVGRHVLIEMSVSCRQELLGSAG